MPTIAELEEWCKFQRKQGKGSLHTNHVVIVEEEVEKRKDNKPDEAGKRKTRIVWEAGDPETFSRFHIERERYMECAGHNPVLATEAMSMSLRAQSNGIIRMFIEAIEQDAEGI